ncbi:MAG: YicC family protein [Acidobacteria bacterium]|nr:YicC family protein [Acidobacteriota bacterium]
MAQLRSMTGFARLRKVTPQGEMVCTLKSVNHRSLDVHLHLPADLDAFANTVRNTVKQKVSRGHVDVRISWIPTASTGLLALNRPLFESWLAAFHDARQRYNLASEPDINAAFRLPGMLSEGDEEPDAALEAFLVSVLNEALDLFNESRAKEGSGLAAVIRDANSKIAASAAELDKLRDKVLPILQDRLQERLTSLLSGVGLEPQRLAQEAAILADRSDVTEEIHRLSIHSRDLSDLLNKGGEIGKKLDFLMQEMGRETNTILSKTNGAGELGLRVTDLGIGVKTEIERIREQSLNIE